MKIIVTFLFIFCISIQSQIRLTQESLLSIKTEAIHNQHELNKFTLKEKDSTGADKSRLSFGVGLATPFGSEKIMFLLNINYNIKIYNPVFLEIGYDAISQPGNTAGMIHGLYVAPNHKINFSDNKYSFFAGIGPVALTKDLPILGMIFFAKIENNSSKSFSYGAALKHENFFGVEFSKYPLFLLNIYLSIKF